MIIIQQENFHNNLLIGSSKIAMKKLIKYIDLELIIWIGGLIYLASINPYETDHFNFCLFNAIGIDFCPGCGLGRSVSYIFHGDFYSSFFQHPLGLFAIIVLSIRIFHLVKSKYITNKSEVLNG